mmetsp:Transcript_20926/g.32804  ORF Transcript_20926/g.32804 Transcript_20926/m.32804 type:complete len:89 (+) Transcript_20926:51-317(+)
MIAHLIVLAVNKAKSIPTANGPMQKEIRRCRLVDESESDSVSVDYRVAGQGHHDRAKHLVNCAGQGHYLANLSIRLAAWFLYPPPNRL